MQLIMVLLFVCVGTFPAVISGELRVSCQNRILIDSLVLQCQVDPRVDLSAKPLDVTRPDLRHQGKDVVHAYRHQQDFLADQMDQYKGRTTLNYEDLKNRTITLRISSVGPSDSGQYRIYVRGLFVRYITVEHQNSTKTDNSSTAAPPVTDVTEPDNPEKKKKLSGPTGPEAEQNSNGPEKGTLMTPETNNSHSTAQNGLMTLTTVSELEDMC
ncbi:butyrophilin-like protein 3 isoform 1-T1 [Acanthopagrus schlegelii]